jgi:hypothetical protein
MRQIKVFCQGGLGGEADGPAYSSGGTSVPGRRGLSNGRSKNCVRKARNAGVAEETQKRASGDEQRVARKSHIDREAKWEESGTKDAGFCSELCSSSSSPSLSSPQRWREEEEEDEHSVDLENRGERGKKTDSINMRTIPRIWQGVNGSSEVTVESKEPVAGQVRDTGKGRSEDAVSSSSPSTANPFQDPPSKITSAYHSAVKSGSSGVKSGSFFGAAKAFPDRHQNRIGHGSWMGGDTRGSLGIVAQSSPASQVRSKSIDELLNPPLSLSLSVIVVMRKYLLVS